MSFLCVCVSRPRKVPADLSVLPQSFSARSLIEGAHQVLPREGRRAHGVSALWIHCPLKGTDGAAPGSSPSNAGQGETNSQRISFLILRFMKILKIIIIKKLS